MKKDYPELRGKKVLVLEAGIRIEGKIVDCNYDIGISIVSWNNPSDHLLCLAGPSSPIYVSEGPGWTKAELLRVHDAEFFGMVQSLLHGVVWVNQTYAGTEKPYEVTHIPASMMPASCPFGQ